MRGKSCVITGANSGIGREIAIALTEAGARVVLASRSRERTQPVIDEIHAVNDEELATFVELDLAEFDSVRRAADEILETTDSIDVLVNNAGVAGAKGTTSEGFELHFGINHLGHFLLTMLLLDRLRNSAPARVVTVSSVAHRRVDGIDFEAVREPTKTWTGLDEYGVSKLANILFSKELDRRPEASGISTYAVHPGPVGTNIWRHVPFFVRPFIKLFTRSPREGAQTPLYCAASPECAEISGKYWVDEEEVRPSSAARNQELATELWERSREWVGE